MAGLGAYVAGLEDRPGQHDPYGFRAHLGVDIESVTQATKVVYADTQDAQEEAQYFGDRERQFGAMAPELLNAQSLTSQGSPQVSQVLRSRLKAVFDQRGNVNFSMCECPGDFGYAGHEDTFQQCCTTLWKKLEKYSRGGVSSTTAKLMALCPDLMLSVDIYGVIGEGTFGIIFLARETNEDIEYNELAQFAIKAQAHRTQLQDMLGEKTDPEMVPFQEPTGQEHYIPEEALILIYLMDSDRFPTVHSIYTHGLLWSIVMHPCIDPSPESIDYVNPHDFQRIDRHGERPVYRYVFPKFPAFSGVYLQGINKQPVLGEMQGCKVAALFLDGMVQLADMGIYHADISVNNYLMDQDLNVQLIDLGQVYFSLNHDKFQTHYGRTIPFQEYQMRPELATEYMKYKTGTMESKELRTVYLPSDRRDISLWKYSTIVYGFLHGYWPWEESDPKVSEWHGKFSGFYDDVEWDRIAARRLRMINEDISVNENLSQDCRDMLQSALARDVNERPSLQEMNSFPWFSQWSDEERESGRPLKRPRIDKFERHNAGPGRVNPGEQT